MKKYICLQNSADGELTAGKTYLIKLDTEYNKRHPLGEKMYLVNYNHLAKSEFGPLNNYWVNNFFREVRELNKQIKIL